MIVRPPRPARRHAITAYDFEWTKRQYEGKKAKLDFVLGGAYDERGYRWYTSIESFIDGELTTENAGRRFYAHFGGASDMVFLLRHLAKRRDWEIRGLFSGSSAIMIRITDSFGRSWLLLDSFWTMRVGLAKIGEWIGSDKLPFDHTREHSLDEWKTYNEQDNRVLWLALTSMQEVVNDRGGELRITGASTSLDLFLRRYLRRPLRNDPEVDAYVRPAYVASRVEKYQDSCRKANVYDINSSFPFSMTFPLPGACLGDLGYIPDYQGSLWVADVDVRVPEQYVPPLPYRNEADHRIYFPTGSFRTRITSEDFKCNDFEILKVHSCKHFEERLDMAEFAQDLYALRAGGGFQSQCWKIIVNSLYGKWGERDLKEVLIVNPREWTPSMKSIAPHIYLGEETIVVEHAHVPFSAFITARSRRILREYELMAHRQGDIYYADCDSVMCAGELPAGTKLGDIKLEAKIVDGTFEGAKLYAYKKVLDEREANKVRGLGQVVKMDDGMAYTEVAKAKGFSRVVSEGGAEGGRLTYADFTAMQEGAEVTIERMRRIRELIREDVAAGGSGFDFTPDVVLLDKRLRFPHPKRASTGDGNTRPWSYQELEAMNEND